MREAFDAAFNHQNLCCTIPSQDPAVQNSPFVPYDPADFEPVVLFELPVFGDVSIVKNGVTASYYSDDPDTKDQKTGEIIKGDRFQGKPTSTGTQFETNDPTKVALNVELQKKFPVGSFIKITRDGKELIAEVDDVKGAKGVDLPKAGADILGIDAEGVAKVSVQLMKPKGCPDVNLARDGHFLDQCYPDGETRLVWTLPSPTFKFRPGDRQGLVPFFWNTWQIADRLNELGLNKGIARLKVVSEYINETGFPYKQYQATFGPFASVEEAQRVANEYGKFCDKFECAPEERAAVAWESSTMILYQRKWTPPQDSMQARYHGDARETFTASIPVPVAAEAEIASSIMFYHVELGGLSPNEWQIVNDKSLFYFNNEPYFAQYHK